MKKRKEEMFVFLAYVIHRHMAALVQPSPPRFEFPLAPSILASRLGKRHG